MVMVKVAVDERTRSELDPIVTAFRAHVVDIGHSAWLRSNSPATKKKSKHSSRWFARSEIKEIVRSGKIAMARAVQTQYDRNRRAVQKAGGEQSMKVYYDRDADLSLLSSQEDRRSSAVETAQDTPMR